MKITLKDGTMIECEVDEFIQLNYMGLFDQRETESVEDRQEVKLDKFFSEPEKEFVDVTEKPVVNRNRPGNLKYKTWSEAEVKLLKENADKGYSELMKLLGRSQGSISGKMSMLNLKTKNVPKQLPLVYPIKKGNGRLLENVIRNMLGSANKKMTYYDVRWIETEPGVEWNESSWSDFTADFMSKSDMISRYFGVKNKFKQVIDDRGYRVIIYTGGANGF